MTFTAAIVGRPNVGKSTLFNRLTGKRHALVDDMPGVTRDRREGLANLAGLSFTVVDTAGLENAEATTLQGRMTAQSRQAIEDADVALFVIDGRAGVTPADEYFANLLRKGKTPVILVVNKAEGTRARTAIAEAHSFGFGEPVAISAEHGEGLVDLYHALAPYGPEEDEKDRGDRDPDIMQIAIVGRPNAGKSTLMNKILGEERVLTSPEAGTTRDSIAIDHVWQGQKLRLVDTAGMRKKANIIGKVEKLAVADSMHAIQYAHVVIMMLDGQAPLEKQDNAIASLVEQEGRAMVIAVNKWDLVEDKSAYIGAIHDRLAHVLPQVKDIPVVPISALNGTGIDKLFKECFRMYKLWNTEIGTGQLNRWLEHVLGQHTLPLIAGRRIKIKYITQKSSRPPTFLLFSNLSEVPDSYLRYMANDMRETFKLPGIPIRIRVRKGKNPYEGKE